MSRIVQDHKNQLKSRKPWNEVFRPTQFGKGFYYIGRCDEWDDGHYILEACLAIGLPHKWTGSESPANAWTREIYAPFLDGGFLAMWGNYWVGWKGGRVFGRRALRYLCKALDLRSPRRFPDEPFVPTAEELFGEIERQRSEPETPERFRARIHCMRRVIYNEEPPRTLRELCVNPLAEAVYAARLPPPKDKTPEPGPPRQGNLLLGPWAFEAYPKTRIR